MNVLSKREHQQCYDVKQRKVWRRTQKQGTHSEDEARSISFQCIEFDDTAVSNSDPNYCNCTLSSCWMRSEAMILDWADDTPDSWRTIDARLLAHVSASSSKFEVLTLCTHAHTVKLEQCIRKKNQNVNNWFARGDKNAFHVAGKLRCRIAWPHTRPYTFAIITKHFEWGIGMHDAFSVQMIMPNLQIRMHIPLIQCDVWVQRSQAAHDASQLVQTIAWTQHQYHHAHPCTLSWSAHRMLIIMTGYERNKNTPACFEKHNVKRLAMQRGSQCGEVALSGAFCALRVRQRQTIVVAQTDVILAKQSCFNTSTCFQTEQWHR